MRQKTTEVSVSDFSSGSYSTLLQEEVKGFPDSFVRSFVWQLSHLHLVCNALWSHCRFVLADKCLERHAPRHLNSCENCFDPNMVHCAGLYCSGGDTAKHKLTDLFLKESSQLSGNSPSPDRDLCGINQPRAYILMFLKVQICTVGKDALQFRDQLLFLPEWSASLEGGSLFYTHIHLLSSIKQYVTKHQILCS